MALILDMFDVHDGFLTEDQFRDIVDAEQLVSHNQARPHRRCWPLTSMRRTVERERRSTAALQAPRDCGAVLPAVGPLRVAVCPEGVGRRTCAGKERRLNLILSLNEEWDDGIP